MSSSTLPISFKQPNLDSLTAQLTLQKPEKYHVISSHAGILTKIKNVFLNMAIFFLNSWKAYKAKEICAHIEKEIALVNPTLIQLRLHPKPNFAPLRTLLDEWKQWDPESEILNIQESINKISAKFFTPVIQNPPSKFSFPGFIRKRVVPNSNRVEINPIQKQISDKFVEAFKDEYIASFFARKFFPVEGLESLSKGPKEGTYIIHLKAMNSNYTIPIGTVIDGTPLPQEIRGIVGKVGSVDKTASRKIEGAYFVLNREIHLEIENGVIYFLTERFERRTVEDHGKAHEMPLMMYISGKSIIAEKSQAKTIFSEGHYASIAPVCMSYDLAQQKVHMTYITDFDPKSKSTFLKLISPFKNATSEFRKEVNTPIPHLQRKEIFARTFENLTY